MKEYKNLNDYELLYMVSENDECAKKMMYDKYKPLIITIAYKYYRLGKKLGLEIDDFIQEGYYGLYQALANFSDDKDCLFYTYAIRSISSKMHNLCVRNNTKKRQVLNNSVSLDMNVGDDDASLIDLIADKSSPNPWKLLDSYDFYDALKKCIYGASLLQSSILELKLNGFNINSISKLLGESKSIVSKNLNKIKYELKMNLR